MLWVILGNWVQWLKGHYSLRSQHRKRAHSCSPSTLLATASVRTVALRNGPLYFLSILQEWQRTKRNDTDYGRLMSVINTPSFMPLKTAFHQLLCPSDWWQDCSFSLSAPQAVYALFPITDADLPLQFRWLWQPRRCHQGKTHHCCHGRFLWGKASSRMEVKTSIKRTPWLQENTYRE